jgi:hypothetical protein
MRVLSSNFVAETISFPASRLSGEEASRLVLYQHTAKAGAWGIFDPDALNAGNEGSYTLRFVPALVKGERVLRPKEDHGLRLVLRLSLEFQLHMHGAAPAGDALDRNGGRQRVKGPQRLRPEILRQFP